MKDGEWISGTGFSLEALLKDMDEKSEQQTPLQVLDELFPNNPVLIMERTSHSVWVNSKALELAGINKDTKRSTRWKDYSGFRDRRTVWYSL